MLNSRIKLWYRKLYTSFGSYRICIGHAAQIDEPHRLKPRSAVGEDRTFCPWFATMDEPVVTWIFWSLELPPPFTLKNFSTGF